MAQWIERQPAAPLVPFPVRAHAWVTGQIPSRGCAGGNHTLMFFSLSLSPPFPSLKINKILKKIKCTCGKCETELGRLGLWRQFSWNSETSVTFVVYSAEGSHSARALGHQIHRLEALQHHAAWDSLILAGLYVVSVFLPQCGSCDTLYLTFRDFMK